MIDEKSLPARLNVAEVCALAGGSTPISVATLDRRIADGRLPRPIDRGRTRLFDRDAVLSALGMKHDDQQPERSPWDFDDDAFDAAFARPIRRADAARARTGAGLAKPPIRAK